MTTRDHAKLLGMLFWIYGGIQLIVLLFLFLFIFSMFYEHYEFMAPSDIAYLWTNSLGRILLIFFLIYTVFGLASVVVNIIAGFGLRKEQKWARRWGVIGSVIACCSLLFGNLFVFALGAALGAYCLWFLFGEKGRHFPDEGPAPASSVNG